MESTSLEIFCLNCGYDLRALASDRCPECGSAVDRSGLTGSRIPWTQRERIGRWRAYSKTMWMIFTRPWRVAEDVARPVSLSDAKRFRLLTLAIALLGPAMFYTGVYGEMLESRAPFPVLPSYNSIMSRGPDSRGPDVGPFAPVKFRALGWALDVGVPIAALIGAWLFFCSASMTASCFFHPARLTLEQQNRAVAMSYYACAPLALTPLVVLLHLETIFGSTYIAFWSPSPILKLAGAIGWFLLAIEVLWAIGVPLVMLRRSTHCGMARTFAALATMLIAWPVLAAIFLIGVPAAYLFVAMAVMSLIA